MFQEANRVAESRLNNDLSSILIILYRLTLHEQKQQQLFHK